MTNRFTIERLETVERLWARLDSRVRSIERAIGLLDETSTPTSRSAIEDPAIERRIERCEKVLTGRFSADRPVTEPENLAKEPENEALALAIGFAMMDESRSCEDAEEETHDPTALLLGLAMLGERAERI